MNINDPGLDEIWQDFYRTQLPAPSPKWKLYKEREALIHFVWQYTQVANTGTQKPIDDLAKKLGRSVEEVAELVRKALELKLLCTPKRGSFRCGLSVIAMRMIARLRIGIQES